MLIFTYIDAYLNSYQIQIFFLFKILNCVTPNYSVTFKLWLRWFGSFKIIGSLTKQKLLVIWRLKEKQKRG